MNRQNSGHYHLDVCIDFYDDLIKNTWTENTFREAMEIYRRNHVRRLYFICHYGYKGGFWEQPGTEKTFPGFQRHIDETYENVGDFLPAAVRAAHAADIPIFAVLKPYESALPATFPEGSPDARRYGKIPRLGGPIWWSPTFTANNPHLRLERDVSDVPEDLDQRVVKSIVFTAEPGQQAQLDPARIGLWVSADNGRYSPYTGPMECRVEKGESVKIVLDGLAISEKFFAIAVTGEATSCFGNILRDLVEVFDTQGVPLPITFSDMSRTRGRDSSDFPEVGFRMDVPLNNNLPGGAINHLLCLDNGRPLCMGLGRMRYLPGGLCEAYPEVRQWWMQQVENCIAAGVDGMDFRIGNHNRTFDWPAYGFNEPIVRAFQDRYGVNILSEPFDRPALRRLRGEFYTKFLREASARLRQMGKTVLAHVDPRMRPSTEHGSMEVHFDWEAWIQEGLLDGVTLKTQTMLDEQATKVTLAAREAGLKVNFCPYVNRIPEQPDARDLAKSLVDEACEGGLDGLIMYENAAFMSATDDGHVEITHPWLLDLFHERAAKTAGRE
jgi:hypothetical protein